jgi:hypothetical protein
VNAPPRGPFPWQLLVLVAGIVCAIVALLITTEVVASGDWRDWFLGAVVASLVSRLP